MSLTAKLLVFITGLSLDFANLFFNTWLRDLEKDMNSLVSILKKAEIDGRLLVGFLPHFTIYTGNNFVRVCLLICLCY